MKSIREQIPNLTPLFESVRDYVKANQGEKGYIDCQPSKKLDTIYGIMYEDFSGVGVEHYVYAVRVVDDDLEVLLEPFMRTYLVTYENEDFTSEDNADKWYSVRWSDVYYVPTLFNIAESIEEYVDGGFTLE